MFGLLRFFFPGYWQRRESVLTNKKNWKQSIGFLNTGGLKIASTVYPDVRLTNFNNQSVHIHNEKVRVSINNNSGYYSADDVITNQNERIINSLENPS